MNSAPLEFARLSPPSQDFRPAYDATLGNMLRVIWRRKFMIAVIMTTCVAAALGIASLMPKNYVGEALVQLTFDSEGAASSSPANGVNAAVDATAIVEGEAEIIRSRAIARRVAIGLWAADDPTDGPIGRAHV